MRSFCHALLLFSAATFGLSCATNSPDMPDAAQTPIDARAADSSSVDVRADVTRDSATADSAPACVLVRPYSTQNATCNSCAQSFCCAPINSCLLATECDDGYVNCAIGCALDPGTGPDGGVPICLSECTRQYPNGRVLYDAFSNCMDQNCQVECQ